MTENSEKILELQKFGTGKKIILAFTLLIRTHRYPLFAIPREEKLKLMLFARMTFIKGSTTYKLTIIRDHENTEMHKRVVREKSLKIR